MTPGRKRAIAIAALVAYGLILLKVIVFKTTLTLLRIGHVRIKVSEGGVGQANFMPFRTIGPYLTGEHGRVIGIINLVGNIALLVPVGLLVPLIFRKMRWPGALAAGVAAGLALEALQVIFHVGVFDIDDVILNALGVVIGYAVFAVIARRAEVAP